MHPAPVKWHHHAPLPVPFRRHDARVITPGCTMVISLHGQTGHARASSLFAITMPATQRPEQKNSGIHNVA